jgi:MarR family transcriptional regulator, negative regulator of the multidrug operon emrRAB
MCIMHAMKRKVKDDASPGRRSGPTTRTANMVGALALAVTDRLLAAVRFHSNQTDTAAAALHLIDGLPGCTNGQLSQALDLSHPATVRLVDRLEDVGLVAADTGADRRTTTLHLTTAGRKLVSSLQQRRKDVLLHIVSVLTPAERAQLDVVAQLLLKALPHSPMEAATICRLCDERDCPPQECPVHCAAIELA